MWDLLYAQRNYVILKMSKKALIVGVTGQDGYYLAKLLLDKGYIVHGIKRRTSLINTSRVDPLFKDMHGKGVRFFLHFGDSNDILSILRIIKQVRPDEVYNIAAQSHVRVSFDIPEYTTNTVALGTLRLLEGIHLLGMEKDVKFYQASSSEMFGSTPPLQSEKSLFQPCSPYAAAKLFAYWITVNYRNSYNMFAVNGILFNHESPLRGETFVTRKITRAVAAISKGVTDCLYIGNLDARRDWGHAEDYAYGMYLMMQYYQPDDFVLATGRSETVRYFLEHSFRLVNIEIEWEGEGLKEVGRNKKNGKIVVRIDDRYFRPTEVEALCGDSSKAKKELKWKPKYTLESLIEDMMQNDLRAISV